MDRLRLLIADQSEEQAISLADMLREDYDIRICRDGMETIALTRTFIPDIFVLDLMLPGLDGITLLQQLEQEGIRPMVLATTRFVSNYVLDAAQQLGVGYVMVKPCAPEALICRINDLRQRLTAPVISQPDPRVTVTNLLLSLGVSTKLHGYGYLREAVILMQRDPNQSITKELYPAVGLRCGATGLQVERAIRTAIRAAWEKRTDSVWRHYFHANEAGQIRRPSNRAFITCLADHLMIQRTDWAEEAC